MFILPYFVLILVVTAVVNAGNWGYPDLQKEEDFPKWGGTCDSGNRQSPIDLSTITAFPGDFRDLKFSNYEQPLLHPKILNNGHTVKITSQSKLSISGGGLRAEYFLIEMHFHWSSEHTINDRKYPLELHLVHMKQNYKNVTEAIMHPDGLAVIGILFHVSSENSSLISPLIDETVHLMSKYKIGTPRKIFSDIIVNDFLPKNPSQNYFFYKGSLTTPPCAEAVIWTVFTETKPVSLYQIEELEKLQTAEGQMVRNNFRASQKIKGRAVTLITDSSSSMLKPFNSILVAVLIFVFAKH